MQPENNNEEGKIDTKKNSAQNDSEPTHSLENQYNAPKPMECWINVPWAHPIPCEIYAFSHQFWDGRNMHYFLRTNKSWWWYDYTNFRWERDRLSDLEQRMSISRKSIPKNCQENIKNDYSLVNSSAHNVSSSPKTSLYTAAASKNISPDPKEVEQNLKLSLKEFKPEKNEGLETPKIDNPQNNIRQSNIRMQSKDNLSKQLPESELKNDKNIMRAHKASNNASIQPNDKMVNSKQKHKSILKKNTSLSTLQIKEKNLNSYNTNPKYISWNDTVETFIYESEGLDRAVSPDTLLLKDVHPNVLKTYGGNSLTLTDYARVYWEKNSPPYIPNQNTQLLHLQRQTNTGSPNMPGSPQFWHETSNYSPTFLTRGSTYPSIPQQSSFILQPSQFSLVQRPPSPPNLLTLPATKIVDTIPNDDKSIPISTNSLDNSKELCNTMIARDLITKSGPGNSLTITITSSNNITTSSFKQATQSSLSINNEEKSQLSKDI